MMPLFDCPAVRRMARNWSAGGVRVLLPLLVPLMAVSPVRAQSITVHDSVDPYVWQRPVAAAATGGLLFAGASTLWSGFSMRQNSLIREEMQLLRRNHFDFRQYRFDNFIQYLPLSASLTLKVAGVPSRHDFWQLSFRTAGAFVAYSVVVQPTKRLVHVMRPDRSSRTSFPSGHSAIAFAGAESLRLEFGDVSPLIPAMGYLVASLTGMMRIYNDRHWAGDVLAGAAIGILSTDISFWLCDRLHSRIASRRLRMDAAPSSPFAL